ncbi:MAG TPA: hypothetical protein VFF67_10595 [Thermoplasmata archaeon]|nr:hypothetical protein [Thermoplasmata archaeon]
MSLVLLVAPSVGAFRPHTYVAPYRGTAATPLNSVSTGGRCHSAAVVTSQHWLPKTGNATSLTTAITHGCASTALGTAYGYGTAYGELQVLWPFTVVTGTHNFTVNVSYAFTIQMPTVGSFSCRQAKNVPGQYTYSYCAFNRSATVQWGFELFDQTNGSSLSAGSATGPFFFNSSFQGNNSYCSGGKCSSNNYSRSCSSPNPCVAAGTLQRGTTSLFLNTRTTSPGWTLNGNHKLWLVLWFSSSALIFMDGYGSGNSAGASVNAATLGNSGWQVTSITIH